MHTRVIALVVGVVGAIFGIAAVVTDVMAFGGAAGIAALAAGVLALAPATNQRDPEDEAKLAQEVADLDAALDAVRADLALANSRSAQLEAEAVMAHAAAVDESAPDVGTLTDPTSQLFSEAYFLVALRSRLASARRHLRPVAVSLLRVVEGQAADNPMPAPAGRVAEAVRETLREADIACRLDDGTFAMILEDTPENGAVWTVERVRRNLVSRFGNHTMWAGVACYPAHAFSTEELLEQARAALDAAQEWKQDRIEVAVAD